MVPPRAEARGTDQDARSVWGQIRICLVHYYLHEW